MQCWVADRDFNARRDGTVFGVNIIDRRVETLKAFARNSSIVNARGRRALNSLSLKRIGLK